MNLYLARHGETDLNVRDAYQGVSDLPLNARGRAQAEALAASLPAGIDRIVASPQQRAWQTAQPAARRYGQPVTPMPDFRERDFGIFEGLNPDELALRHPGLWASGVVMRWDDAPPGGETPQAVVTRVAAGLRALQAAHAGHTVLLVAHGFVVRSVRFLASGIAPAAFFDENKIGNGEWLFFPALRLREDTDQLLLNI